VGERVVQTKENIRYIIDWAVIVALLLATLIVSVNTCKEQCKDCYRAFEQCHSDAINLSEIHLEPINATNETIITIYKATNQIKLGVENVN